MKIQSIFGPDYRKVEIGDIANLSINNPFKLSCGEEITNFPIAYQTYGKLNQAKDNAILICHALTGDQYVASKNPVIDKDGWWDFLIGKGKAIDTDKFFVICSNVLGGCMGSFGPKNLNLDTNKIYGNNFPFLTIHDMVRAQKLLIEYLGIDKLHAVIGGSMGGMQVLSWGVQFPNDVKILIPIATSYRYTPQNIAFHEVGRQAIINDPKWLNGDYLMNNEFPTNGLALARMTANITYLSENALQKKFGRDLNNKNENFSFSMKKEFQVENYLHYQSKRFVQRFDPNSYLIVTRAVDYFDLETDFGGKLSQAFLKLADNKSCKVCVIAFTDDWLFPPSESRKLVYSLGACNIDVSSVIVDSYGGHDSFLLQNNIFEKTINSLIC
jgi:homoserine O-acetyltransferase